MSESISNQAGKRFPLVACSVLVLCVVMLRVWVLAENLSSTSTGSHTASWTDAMGITHTITMSVGPDQNYEQFLAKFRIELDRELAAFPRSK